MPSRRFPVTRRSRYRASSGVARASSPPSSSSLRPCEPGPSASAISRSVFTTVTTVSSAAGPPRRRPRRPRPAAARRPGPGRPPPGPGTRPALVNAGRGRDRADGQLLGQAQVNPGELRRDQPLAQVADHRQQPLRGLRQQRRQPLDQRQPPADLLEVAEGLGHRLVPHAVIMTRYRPNGPCLVPPSTTYGVSRVRAMLASANTHSTASRMARASTAVKSPVNCAVTPTPITGMIRPQ